MNYETIRRVTADLTDRLYHLSAVIALQPQQPQSIFQDRIRTIANLVAILSGEVSKPIPTAPTQATEGEATELAAWLDNHVRQLQTLQVNLDVMPSTEIVLFSRIAELLRQLAPASAPAAEGEAEATAIKLQQLAPQNPLGIADPTIVRAAELLRQQAHASVAFRERPWERDGWCDEQGRCWIGDPGGNGFIPSWRLCRPEECSNFFLSQILPHWAIPSIPIINPTQEEA